MMLPRKDDFSSTEKVASRIVSKTSDRIRSDSILSTIIRDAGVSGFALHPITLFFLSVGDTFSEEEWQNIENEFAAWFVSAQRRVHRFGLLFTLFFLTTLILYDYKALVARDITRYTSLETSPEVSRRNFYILLYIRLGILVPIKVFTLWASWRKNYADYWLRVWCCNIVLAAFPPIYSFLAMDFGVTWFCIFLFILFNFSPTRFIYNFLLALTSLGIYTLLIFVLLFETDPNTGAYTYNSLNEDTVNGIVRDVLYLFAFFGVLCATSYSREYCIRLQYMGELSLIQQQEVLQRQEERGEELLHSMLPVVIIEQLKGGHERIADAYDQVTVLFAEVCDFDIITSKLAPEQVVELLNVLFSCFDHLVDQHDVHKVETIGAVYMVCGGCPDRVTNHAELCAGLALDMVKTIPGLRQDIKQYSWGTWVGERLNVRIGLNTGPVIAGIVGIRNPRFKLFGDTVNTASRMESKGVPGKIQISQSTQIAIAEKFQTESRGKVAMKGKGEMTTFFLVERHQGVPERFQSIRKFSPNSRETLDFTASEDYFAEEEELDAFPSSPTGLSRGTLVRERVGKLMSAASGREKVPAAGHSSRESIGRNSLNASGKTRRPSAEVVYFDGAQKIDLHKALQNFISAGNDSTDKKNRVRSFSQIQRDQLQEMKKDNKNLGSNVSKREMFWFLPGWTDRNLGLRASHTFEVEYRRRHRNRWLHFFRRTVLVGLAMTLLSTIYSVLYFAQQRNNWTRSDQAYNIFFCGAFPIVVAILLFSFMVQFRYFEQLILLGLVVAVTLMADSFGNMYKHSHGPYTYIAVLQCHLHLMALSLRVFSGIFILLVYVLPHVPHIFRWAVGDSELKEEDQVIVFIVLRGAMYIALFLASQVWIVGDAEFKQRLNFFRARLLASQRSKMLEEQKKIDKLLLNLLPETIVHQLKEDPTETIAEKFDSVTILFTDMVQFTAFSSRIQAMELVRFLNDMFTRFDTITDKYSLYKVEIIGDAYFVVGGCPVITENHAIHVIRAAIDMLKDMQAVRVPPAQSHLKPQIRIGVHTGPVIAGVVGSKDPRYHLFGDTVEVAQMLESSGEAGRVHVSEATYKCVRKIDRYMFDFEYNKMVQHGKNSTLMRT